MLCMSRAHRSWPGMRTSALQLPYHPPPLFLSIRSTSVRNQGTDFTTCHVHTMMQSNSQRSQRNRDLCPPPTHTKNRRPVDGRPHCYSGMAWILVSVPSRSQRLLASYPIMAKALQSSSSEIDSHTLYGSSIFPYMTPPPRFLLLIS